MALQDLHVFKLLIAAAAIVLLFVVRFVERRGVEAGRNPLDLLLGLLALVAVFAYFDFGYYPKFGQFQNPHDFFHYYMGAKYSDEIGYLNLYPCVIVASYENNDNKRLQANYRDMTDYSFKPAQDIVADAERYRGLFTPARWMEFRKDARFFQFFLGQRRWKTVVRDKGYNATPVWNMTARFLTNRAPVTWGGNLRALMLLDLFLVALAVILLWMAFGYRTAMFGLIAFCTCFSMSYTHIRGAFLRLDWVTLLVMTTCMLKMGRYKTGGLLFAYAGMARMFPLAFGFGMGAKFLWDLYHTRKLNRKYLEFFVALGLGCAALVGLSAWLDGGFDRWPGFFAKIALHDHDLSGMRVGFKYLFLMNYDNPTVGWPTFEAAQLATLERFWWFLWGIRGLVLMASLWLVKGLDDYETIPYGYVPAYFLTAPTFYYHVMIWLSFFLFLPKRDQMSRAIGAAGVFGVSILLFILNRSLPIYVAFSWRMSALLLGLVLYMAVACAITTASARKHAASEKA